MPVTEEVHYHSDDCWIFETTKGTHDCSLLCPSAMGDLLNFQAFFHPICTKYQIPLKSCEIAKAVGILLLLTNSLYTNSQITEITGYIMFSPSSYRK